MTLLNEEDDSFDNLSDSDNIIPEEIMQSKEKQRLLREIIDTELTEMQKLCIVAYYYIMAFHLKRKVVSRRKRRIVSQKIV